MEEARTGEEMAQELSRCNDKITFAKADCQAMGVAQLQDILKMLNMRG